MSEELLNKKCDSLRCQVTSSPCRTPQRLIAASCLVCEDSEISSAITSMLLMIEDGDLVDLRAPTSIP